MMSQRRLLPRSAIAVVVSRRRFLEISSLGTVGSLCALCRPTAAAPPVSRAQAAIVICNIGGPSQLDTWDPKPDAPREVRGPFRAIRTSVPGIFVSELFPRMARLAHLQAFVRACHRPGLATHEAGWRCAFSGLADSRVPAAPGLLDLVNHALSDAADESSRVPCTAVLPSLGHRLPPPTAAVTVANKHGTRGATAAALEQLLARESDATRAQYGHSQFGRDCLLARCLVEAGTRCVVIRTCRHYRAPHSWDVHGGPAFDTVSDLRRDIAPAYDQAYAALLEDLAARGLLDSTLVCAVAEFGRTPRLNPAGGRDHWPHCWTSTFAGGGVQGGQTVGASDRSGSEPACRPVSPDEIIGSICLSLGIAASPARTAAVTDHPLLVASALPRIAELF